MPVRSSHDVLIPIRLLEDVYGKDNLDDAGDDLAALLKSSVTTAVTVDFDLDTAHPNPWFHTLVMRIDGLDATDHQRLQVMLAHRGLIA